MANEKRLIYAEEAVELINGLDSLPWEEETEALVNSLTTVDAVEVVHGKAVPIRADIDYEDTLIRMDRQCNKCGALITQMDNYCPNCGAKMDGERKDND